jgi:hypothetical protein
MPFLSFFARFPLLRSKTRTIDQTYQKSWTTSAGAQSRHRLSPNLSDKLDRHCRSRILTSRYVGRNPIERPSPKLDISETNTIHNNPHSKPVPRSLHPMTAKREAHRYRNFPYDRGRPFVRIFAGNVTLPSLSALSTFLALSLNVNMRYLY